MRWNASIAEQSFLSVNTLYVTYGPTLSREQAQCMQPTLASSRSFHMQDHMLQLVRQKQIQQQGQTDQVAKPAPAARLALLAPGTAAPENETISGWPFPYDAFALSLSLSLSLSQSFFLFFIPFIFLWLTIWAKNKTYVI